MELARKVISLTDSASELVFKPLPSDNPLQRKPDLALAKAALGWRPTIQLEEGLKKTIAYFRSLQQAADREWHGSVKAALRVPAS